jgi:hypothetical protein
VWINYDNPDCSNVWTTPGFKEYLRYVAMSYGLNGLFIYATPREFIEGYTDPLLETLSETPVYEGGDQTISPFMSLDAPPTHPKDNSIAFYTGEDDYTLTRAYALWLDEDYITVYANDYESLYTVVPAPFNPWSEQIPLYGTDGMQFQPLLEEDIVIDAFVNDLSRTCPFEYRESSDVYPHLNTMLFYLPESVMLNKTANPDNAVFEVEISGTTNMTSTLKAPAFASKGHYY